jgi:phthiodiolone/phenolphthiodiolone dimycocerosates ketoreductase
MLKFAMELGFAPFDELFRRARKAENSKFDFVFYYDHSLSWHQHASDVFELWTTLTALAANTKRIRLAPLVTDGVRRHPSIVAQSVLTLDQFSLGRTTLCVGAGSAINLNPFGIEWNRDLRKLRETIEIIKMLWTAKHDSPANFEGKFFSLDNAFLQVETIQKPRPPVYQSAFGRSSRIMAGEIADGLVVANESPEMVRESRTDFQFGAEKRGGNIEESDLVVHVPTAISKDVDSARKSVLTAIRQELVAQPFQRRRLGVADSEKFRLLDEYRRIGMKGVSHTELLKATEEAGDLIPENVTEKLGIFGTPDDCIAKIEKYHHAGAKTVSLANCGPNLLEVEEEYANHILPYFLNG